MKIALVKNINNTFSLAYESDYEIAKKLPVGEVFFFDVKKSRNIKFHRKFFALIKLVFDNQEIYNNTEDLRHDLTVAAGYYIEGVNIHGEVIKRAKSISFGSMSELEFSEYYDAVIKQVTLYFKITSEQVKENINQYF